MPVLTQRDSTLSGQLWLTTEVTESLLSPLFQVGGLFLILVDTTYVYVIVSD